jgi:hypothetical protein
MKSEHSNFWGIDEASIDNLLKDGELDLGKWYFYYNDTMKEWEATMSGTYTHVFKNIDDLLQRKNEVDFYEHNQELSDNRGEEVITNSKGQKRIY